MFLMISTFLAPDRPAAYSFLRRRPRSYQKKRSLLASPGGSAVLWWYWIVRWVWVIDPSFSAMWAAGSKKTSVWISAGLASACFQKIDDSVSYRSFTTSHFSLVIALRWKPPLRLVAGF